MSMVSYLDTTVSLKFGDDNYSQQINPVVLETSKKAPIVEGTSYFLLHTILPGVYLKNTSGFIFLVNSSLLNHYEELIGFNGDRVKTFKYPNIKNITIKIIGGLQDKTGNPVTVTLNTVKKLIIASKPCYGYVSAKYDVQCQLWQANFEGQCPQQPASSDSPNPDDFRLKDAYVPIFIFAIKSGDYLEWKHGEILTTLELTGSCENDGQPSEGNANFESSEKLPNIKLEIDQDDPPQLTSGYGPGPVAGCSVRMYPGSLSPDYLVTAGKIISNSNSAIQMQVRETITFQGSYIVSTKYTPSSLIIAKKIGTFPKEFINKFGEGFSPNIILPGKTIVIVEWIGAGHYRNPRPRKLNANEIGIGDFFKNAIESFGVIEVTYSVTYKKTKYIFGDYDYNTRRFPEAFLVVKDGNKTGNLKLNPPKMKGMK